jgi:hypothetical protein
MLQFWDYTTVFSNVMKTGKRALEARYPGRKLTPQTFYAESVDYFAKRDPLPHNPSKLKAPEHSPYSPANHLCVC